jgi:hypothetical protein
LSYLTEDLTGEKVEKVPVYCDNEGAVKLVYNPEFHQRTKHIKLKWHWIREQVNEDKIVIKFVGTVNQLADIFTKSLAGQKFLNMRMRIGVGQLCDLPCPRFREDVEDKSRTIQKWRPRSSRSIHKRLLHRPKMVAV